MHESYAQYKSATNTVINWLVKQIPLCGFGKNKVRRLKSTKTLPTRIIEEITDATVTVASTATNYAKNTSSEKQRLLPIHVEYALKTAIRLRKEAHQMFARTLSASDNDLIETRNQMHLHFIQVLEYMRDRLVPAQPKKTEEADVGQSGKATEAASSSENRFKALESTLSPTAAEEELEDELPALEELTMDEPEATYTFEIDVTEPVMDCYFLFSELNEILSYVVKTWNEFKEGKCSFIAAVQVTNHAYLHCKSLEEQNRLVHPHVKDYESCLGTLFPGGQDVMNLVEIGQDAFDSMFMFTTAMFLIKFCPVIQKGHAPVVKKGHFGIFDEEKPQSWKKEQTILLAEYLGDLVSYCSITKGLPPIPFLDDFNEFRMKKVVTVSLVFGCRLMLLAAMGLRGQLSQTLPNIQNRLRILNASLSELSSEDFEQYEGRKEFIGFLKLMSELGDKLVLNDPLRFIAVRKNVAENFSLYNRNPFILGLIYCSIMFMSFQVITEDFHGRGMLFALIHHYNALRQKQFLKQEIPILEKVTEYFGEFTFIGKIPEGDFNRAFSLSLGMKPEAFARSGRKQQRKHVKERSLMSQANPHGRGIVREKLALSYVCYAEGKLVKLVEAAPNLRKLPMIARLCGIKHLTTSDDKIFKFNLCKLDTLLIRFYKQLNAIPGMNSGEEEHQFPYLSGMILHYIDTQTKRKLVEQSAQLLIDIFGAMQVKDFEMW